VTTVMELSEQQDHEDERTKVLIDLSRTLIAQDYQVAERLDAKARNLITTVGIWFGFAQTATGALVVRRNDLIDFETTQAKLVTFALIAAGIATILVGVLIAVCTSVWNPRDEHELTSDQVQFLWNSRVQAARSPLPDILQQSLRVLESRRANNAIRASRLKRAQVWWAASLIVSVAQLVLVVLARFVKP